MSDTPDEFYDFFTIVAHQWESGRDPQLHFRVEEMLNLAPVAVLPRLYEFVAHSLFKLRQFCQTDNWSERAKAMRSDYERWLEHLVNRFVANARSGPILREVFVEFFDKVLWSIRNLRDHFMRPWVGVLCTLAPPYTYHDIYDRLGTEWREMQDEGDWTHQKGALLLAYTEWMTTVFNRFIAKYKN